MVGDREPVRLIAYLLDEERRLLVPVEGEGVREVRHEYLFIALGDGDDRDFKPEIL